MSKRYPPEPPYRWNPLGTKSESRPVPGSLVAWRHGVWRVIEHLPLPEVDWTDEDRQRMEHYNSERRAMHAPIAVVIRPAHIVADDPRSRDYDVHLRVGPWNVLSFDVYPHKHYPVCVRCNEPVPCREEMADRLGKAAEEKAARYEIPGVCPACQEIPSARQKVMTFGENLRVPFGPPVTFHVGRQECREVAAGYEKELAEQTPGYQLVLSCPGTAYVHVDGPECTEGAGCRGLKFEHATVHHCDDRCLHCRDIRAGRADTVAARQAAGDWTVW